MSFTKTDAQVVREELDKVLPVLAAALTKRLGRKVEAKGGRGVFDGGGIDLKFRVSVADESGAVQTREVQALKQLAAIYGLPGDALGRKFVTGGKEFTVSGVAARRSKRPILATDASGKTFCFSSEAVAALLAHQAVKS